MEREQEPDKWSLSARGGVAVLLGVLWAFLWLGLPRDVWFYVLFPLLSGFLLGPTLGAIARGRWKELWILLATSILVSALAAPLLAPSVGLTRATSGEEWRVFYAIFVISWLPASIVSYLTVWLRRRESRMAGFGKGRVN